jgi:hypothetical protein
MHPAAPTAGLPDRFRRIVLLAPIVFIAHVLEEGTSFVAWFNDHVARGITPGLFWTVNLTALVITLLLAVSVRAARSAGVSLLLVGWLSFLMLTNAVFHVTAAVVDSGYVPGLVTAVVLYLPYCVWLGMQLVRTRVLPAGALAAAAVIGGLPMAIHGYRILFRGDRLF